MRAERAAQDALGQEDDEQHQQDAVDQVVPADRLGAEADAQDLGQQDGDDGADRRPERHVDAADHGGEHHLQRDRDAAHRVGRDEHLVLAVERTGEGRHQRADHRDLELLRGHIDARRRRGVLVLRDRLQRVAVMLRSTQRQTSRPTAQTPSAIRYQVDLVVELQRQRGRCPWCAPACSRASRRYSRGRR